MTDADAAMPTNGQGVQEEITGFRVALANFTGPFDLLLQLIHSHKMDVTEVALAQVTDEFVSYTRSLSKTEDLDEITEFLVIAARSCSPTLSAGGWDGRKIRVSVAAGTD